MRVRIAGEAFTDDGLHQVLILMSHFIEGRHEWVVDAHVVDVMSVYFRRNVPGLAQGYRLMAEKAMVDGAWGAPVPTAVTVTSQTIKDDVADLHRPAKVVVENQESDRAFVLAMAHVFAAQRVIDAYEKGWLEFSHGGGSGDLPKIVLVERNRFLRHVRVVFILDSDRLVPGARSKHDRNVAAMLDMGVSGHLLKFREAENYIPLKVLAASGGSPTERSKKLHQVKSLNPGQRAHYDVKKGFWSGKTNSYVVPPEQEDLFGSVDPKVIRGIGKGFGDGMCGVFEREAIAGRLNEADLDLEAVEDMRAMLRLLDEII